MKAFKPAALDAALKLLAGKDYSAAELADKLTSRGYPQDEIDRVLTILRHYHCVADTGRNTAQLEQMSAAWLAKRRRGLTPSALRGLEAHLLKKGFDPDLVRAHLEDLASQLN
mgnify:CR=1 FL=1